jgi:ABC-type nitrate/sulfonate/bicarbonate transport system ATPase subunit
MVDLLGLTESENYYPAQLSGGMLQRIAIGRTLILDPKLVLMDEPFTGLDYARRRELHQVVRRLTSEMRVSIVLVTHDIEDAVRLGNRIAVLSEAPATVVAVHDCVQALTDLQKEALIRALSEG